MPAASAQLASTSIAMMRATDAATLKAPAILLKKEEATADACSTKMFGQCAGMNFTSTKSEKKGFNFTEGGEQFACCPVGSTCMQFGPVWGMCMPDWGAPAAPAPK